MIPEQTLLGFPLFGDNATKVEPDNNKKSNGWQQGDVVPAEWMNWEWYHASKGVADLNKGVTSMEKEINNVLSSFGISPAEATNNQLLTAMRLNASFVTATGTTITGPLLVSGGTIRVMFTQAIAGSDTSTGLSLTYNTQSIAVKVNKNGAKANFVATEVSTGTYKYLQAYTTLELVYDGVDFLIVGNPVVLSGTNYTVYADGKKGVDDIRPVNSVYVQYPKQKGPNELFPLTTWTEINYDGAFFRANGGGAGAFVDESSQTNVGYILNSQQAQLPKIVGEIRLAAAGGDATGAFSRTSNPDYDEYSVSAGDGINFTFDSSRAGASADYLGRQVYKTNGEVRPDNWTIKIWKRTA